MIVILTLIIQIIICMILALVCFVFRRKSFISDTYESAYLTSRYLMGCRLDANKLVLKKKVIVTCNHPTNVDFIYLLHWARLHNRLGDLRFISKNSIGNIPFFGSYIKETHCLIARNYEQDYQIIIDFCQRLNDSDRYILVIFPEGTTLCPETKEKSFTFCKEKGKPIFGHLLYPRHRGLDLIISHLQLEQWVDITLFYRDDPSCYKCNYAMDILFDSYPKQATMKSKEINLTCLLNLTVEQKLEQLWLEKENFLSKR